jgi:hypothetical protein
MSTENQLTFLKALKAGTIAGLIAAGLNNIWSLIANALGATIPSGFTLAITMSSIFPLLIGAMLFFVFVRFLPKGKLAWISLAVVFALFSFYPVFSTPQLPDGTALDETFPLLVGPMHLISGFLAVWGIPRWSN